MAEGRSAAAWNSKRHGCEWAPAPLARASGSGSVIMRDAT